MLHRSLVTVVALASLPTASTAQHHDHEAAGHAATSDAVRLTRVRLSTGVELQVAERGQPDGQPVLFLHGFTDSYFSFTPMLERLPSNIRAIVPSQRGHGDSERPECCYAIDNFAADAMALLDKLGIERATVVGHSMGSFVAQRIALQYPQRVERLVLIGSGLTPRTEAATTLVEAARSLTDPVAPAFVREFQQSTLTRPVPPEFFAGVVRESGKLPARVWRDALAGLLAHERVGDLSRIGAGTLLVWGARDAYWPRPQQDSLLATIPGSRLLVYQDVGHAPHWEDPARFVADLLQFLSGSANAAHAHDAPVASSVGSVRKARIRLSTGVELEVAERGRPDGRPVLFLHGFTDSWYSFTRMLDELPAAIRAIVPSQRGHGDSERPTCCYKTTDYAADAIALLDALGIQRATVVGHSNGSFYAQRLAIEHPERVERLVLVGSGATPRTKPMLELDDAVRQLSDPIARDFVHEFQESTLANAVPPAYLERVVDESHKVPARVWRDVLGGLLAQPATGELGRIQAPTLVIWGAKDGLFEREAQQQLVREIKGVRFIAYHENGHAPHWEDPARFVGDLLAFLGIPTQGTSGAEPPRSEGHAHDAKVPPGPMPILAGLGQWTVLRITTASPDAQRYFDQGLRLMYAFNHDEAARSFERAVELDSSCALCHWGLAYALGPNINLPMDPAAEPRALASAREAVRLKGRASAKERALIDAMAVRYGEPSGKDRAARDSAYARAMRGVTREFGTDPDVLVVFADAMLNLRPWNQFTREGQAQPGTLELVAALERALKRAPDHAGACHFYIHAVEASPTPERALPCAERLPRLMPGAGHVVHMPAHVYLRVGRYEDAARANIAAVEADGRYFEARDVPEGIYPLFYAPHNLHFLWATYVLSGQRTKALNVARTLKERVKLEDARAAASLEAFLTAEALTLARFGEWDAILALPAPPPDLRYLSAIWHYARGLARAARGEATFASAELDSLRALAARVPDDVIIILNPAPAVLKLAAEVLAGRLAAHQKRHDDAVAHFRAAVRLEDGLTYDEPPPWYHSARNLLGEALLEARRYAEAEAAFRDDLRFVRETGWSLAGLERALRGQGKRREAAEVARRLEKAWQFADVPTYSGRN